MDDLISRQAAIGELERRFDGIQMLNWKENPNAPFIQSGILWSMNTIRDLPSVQPERKKGKWILVHETDETGNATYECSICHRGEVHVPIVDVSFCWNCGADMRGTDE